MVAPGACGGCAEPVGDTTWSRVIGPVYTTKSLEAWLGISRQAISQASQAMAVLRLKTSDGVAVYPAFQFDDDGSRLPDLPLVLTTLAKGVCDPWTWAWWLNTPDDDGQSFAAGLRLGQVDLVLQAAERDAQTWAAGQGTRRPPGLSTRRGRLQLAGQFASRLNGPTRDQS